jgi:MFS family permease
VRDRFAKNAALLWSGQFVAQMGDAVFLQAVAWLASVLGGSGAATGIVVFLSAVPFLLFGPFAGAWVDRGDRRRIMIGSDLARAAILLATWLVSQRVGASLPLVAVAAFCLATASTPFLPARDALLPRLAEGRSLVRFNAAFQTSGQLAQIAGLLLAGVLLGTNPKDVARVFDVLALDGIGFLASAATLAFVVVPALSRVEGPALSRVEGPALSRVEGPALSRVEGPALTRTAGDSPVPGPATSVWRDAIDGLRDARRDPLLRGLLILTALDNLAIMGPAIVGATLLVGRDFKLGPGHLAWFEGAMAAGFFVGALALARYGDRLKKGPLILWGMALDGATYVPLFWIDSYPVALVTVFLHGLVIPAIVVGRTSLLQGHVGEGRTGKAFALVHLTVAGMTALSALASGFLAEAIGARGLFLAAGVFGTLCGVLGAWALPNLRRA